MRSRTPGPAAGVPGTAPTAQSQPSRSFGPPPGRRRGRLRWLAGAVALVVVAVVASITLGARGVPLGDVVPALLAPDPADTDHTVVTALRVPRTLIGLLAGGALGAAGALMQGLTRNPLADPGLLGVNAGASLAVVTAVTVLGVTRPAAFVWFALAGAGLAAVTVLLIGARGPASTPTRLALAGAALTAGLTSLITVVVVTDLRAFDAYRFWVAGSLTARGSDAVVGLLPFFAAGGVLAALATRTLDLLALGEETARGLGQHVTRGRVLVVAAVVLLAGAATALAGPVVFVGLVVPHLVRGVARGHHGWLLALAVPLGAALLLAADVLGRMIAPPGEIEAGLVVAFVGAPVMIALVQRTRPARP